jgi:hypothetical protein
MKRTTHHVVNGDEFGTVFRPTKPCRPPKGGWNRVLPGPPAVAEEQSLRRYRELTK